MSSSQSIKRNRASSGSQNVPTRSLASTTSPGMDNNEEDIDVSVSVDLGEEDLPNERTYITPKRKRSEFWNHFKEYFDKRKKRRAECIHCLTTFASDPNLNGTKNLSKHWTRCLENPENHNKGTPSTHASEKSGEVSMSKMKNWVFDMIDSRKSLSRMIVVGELPFMFVEKPFFKDFMASVCPAFKLPSCTTVRRDCFQLYLDEKEKLLGFIRNNCQRVCLTTDTWTSIQRVNYMCLTAHFIDSDWRLHKRILSFRPIVSHKGEDIASLVEDCLRPWNLCDKIFTVTVDNASANDVACAHLRQRMIANGSSIKKGKFVHMRCTAHIANLIVTAGLKKHKPCIEKIRTVVKFVRNSAPRLHMFKKEVENLEIECKSSLIFDVPTRWNSTYVMLDIALKYKNVFARLDTPRGENGEYLGQITTEEWASIENVVIFLKEFYEFTKSVSGSSYVTVGNVFVYISHIILLLKERMGSCDALCQSMATDMKVKCDKYWGEVEQMNIFTLVAMILNPNYKFQGLKMVLQDVYVAEKGERVATNVKIVTRELFEEYRNIYGPPSLGHGDQASTNGIDSGNLRHTEAGAPSYMVKLSARLNMLGESDGSFTSEFDRYFHELASPCEPSGILIWWKLNESRFPIFARIARDILAIPVTTVPSESAFSTGERTLDQFRSSLSSELSSAHKIGFVQLEELVKLMTVNV